MFHIGQEVVCIRDKDTWFDITGTYLLPEHFPQLNEICVVTGAINVQGDSYLFLRGFDPLHSWAAEAFRPLVKPGALDVFEKMLRPDRPRPARRHEEVEVEVEAIEVEADTVAEQIAEYILQCDLGMTIDDVRAALDRRFGLPERSSS